ncbi:hypothetical protein MtrunA17_Chr8g0386031 [Medicago truncatula]|uniref:Transmembrane protein, putative n=1 Tax=Medicago truncatula TaxID=3880 RepID=A0A072TUZ9_MEDTR|nr:transmembrane protein, putative [Medicago truncatula]RHN43274.1 hypothetical protein MtrunA17_Chr8g0386031 [Medicago truncatula]
MTGVRTPIPPLYVCEFMMVVRCYLSPAHEMPLSNPNESTFGRRNNFLKHVTALFQIAVMTYATYVSFVSIVVDKRLKEALTPAADSLKRTIATTPAGEFFIYFLIILNTTFVVVYVVISYLNRGNMIPSVVIIVFNMMIDGFLYYVCSDAA